MLIAARNALNAGKQAPVTAANYVQTGLVAMWDGIENAGWGTHDPTATTWVDLSANGYDLTGHGNLSWASDAAEFDGATRFQRTAMSTVLSAEIVFRRGVATGFMMPYQNGTRHLIGLNDKMVCLAYTTGSGTSTYRNVFGPIVDTDAHSCSVQYNDWSFWKDGVQQSSSGRNANGAGGSYLVVGARYFSNAHSGFFNGKIYCLRLYSRALTADEIAANYAVDKARFKLPDAT